MNTADAVGQAERDRLFSGEVLVEPLVTRPATICDAMRFARCASASVATSLRERQARRSDSRC
jgi:hypothetical protein